MRPALALPALALGLGLLTASCGDAADPAEESTGSPSAAATFPVTVEHVYGETVVESRPERVASVAWANHEVPLALGVVPVGMSEAAWGDDDGDGVLPWVEERLEELDAETPVLFDESDGIDFEAVAATEPDVILAAYSGLTQEDYDTLSQIAPVVAYPEVAWGTTWQEMVRLNSRALGLEQEGEELVTELEGYVEETFAEHPDLGGAGVLFSWLDPTDLSQIGFYTTHDTRPGFLAEQGMATPAVVAEATAAGEEFYTTISAERGDELADVDLLVTYGDPDGSTLELLQADPVIGKIPAVAAGAVAVLPDATPLAASANPSPLSIRATLADYVAVLDDALGT